MLFNSKNKIMAATLMCVAATGAATAQTFHCSDADNTKQCERPIGWYVGAEFNYNHTDLSSSDVERYYDVNGITADALSFDKSDFGYKAFAGYKFDSLWSLEGGYLDLGDRQLRFKGEYTDQQVFYDTAEDIYPESGKGLFAALMASYSLTENIDVAAKLGIFDWQGKFSTSEFSTQVGSSEISGTDIFYGAEVNYQLDQEWQLYVAVSNFHLNRDTNQQLAVGVRYFFGVDDEAPVLTPPPVIEPIKDSDQDGVFDPDDQCPGSDIRYVVDSVGCTVMEERREQFKLVILYANDSALIDQSYHPRIKALAEFIETYNVQKLAVYGHTSEPGSRSYNQALSERRAQSVAEALHQQFGIDKSVIKPIGLGEDDLVDLGDTEESHARNRRIELTINEMLVLPVEK
ncbi:OmpA family protein [Thalassotalea ponticola]|uniref:OmpA family protein n=1 Tax=Thalassotalea ponticola TaxID=1523392 RepID=UPI0025B5E342|nr:OmpA family protein [Thalassotalea ponticola]MDN3653325.1 OmpA family protein [Thalassotalea ponticola]